MMEAGQEGWADGNGQEIAIRATGQLTTTRARRRLQYYVGSVDLSEVITMGPECLRL
jgi:hypothetical protein